MNFKVDYHLQPPVWQFNGHIQTIYPSLYRSIPVNYVRERLELPDGDFLDLDWSNNNSDSLVVVTHGLEGDSTRHYVTGMIRAFKTIGFDGLGWNSRSCSGELNRLPRFYHHGDAEDLRAVIEHAKNVHGYKKIFLVGFSMGGSLTLRYLGEKPNLVAAEVIGAVAASVPLDLYEGVHELDKFGKRFYMDRFIKKLAVKIEEKSKRFPDNELLEFKQKYAQIKNFIDFDNAYTAPLHGYADAIDFYTKASAKQFIPYINVPTTVIQALNDPFLSQICFNWSDVGSNDNCKLHITDKGGHVGFMERGEEFTYVERFCVDLIKKSTLI